MHKVLLLNIGVYNNSGANRTGVTQATVYVRALLERVLKYVALQKKQKKKLQFVFTQTKGNAHV